MTHTTPNTSSLQSLLFTCEDFGSCFFREPSDRELEFLSYYTAVQQLLSPADHEGDAAPAAGERQPQEHRGHQQGAQPGDGVQALPGCGTRRRAVRPAWPGDAGLPRGDGQQDGRPPEHRQHHRSGEGEAVRQGEEGGIPRTGARREEGAQEERVARGEGASRAEGAGGTGEARIPI